ncbi:MAG: hypothetical protein CTY19_08160 [Methylomonas sp.]|jgi:hypothetical protein|nr:MAG: hypothetical protein CTY19_08160 [Methylomonas sp.]
MSLFDDLILRLESLQGEIVYAIETDDWDGLNRLLVERQETLEQLCALPLQSGEKIKFINMMVLIQDADKHFVNSVSERKQALHREALSLLHDRKAIKAYQTD